MTSELAVSALHINSTGRIRAALAASGRFLAVVLLAFAAASIMAFGVSAQPTSSSVCTRNDTCVAP